MAMLAAVGDAFIDRYLAPVGLSLVGGNALNVAVHLARLGGEAAFFGAVGDDPAGERIRRTLEGEGVATRHLVTLEGASPSTDIGVDAAGERTFLSEDYAVATRYAPDTAALEALRTARLVHIGWLADAPALRAALAGAGALVSQDTAVAPQDGDLDVAFASAGPSREAAQALLNRLLSRNRLAVVTLGALGAVASDGRETAQVGISPVDVVDTTGAGDCFAAAFLLARVRGAPLAECLAAGRDAAAVTCTHLGAFPQRPEPL